MKSRKSIISAILALTLSGCVIHVNGKTADVKMEKTLSVPSENLSILGIDAGAGSLEIIGVDNATEIQVEAKIVTTKEKDFTLTLDTSGSTAYLVAEHNSHSGFWNGSSPSIDLVVTMPKSLLLDIEDGSGEIQISDVNNDIKIVDGSGSTNINNIKGNVDIKDGSGSIVMAQIGGNVNIDDGSGSITIANVNGDLSIQDGSGGIDVLEVDGTVTIDDGSGDIDVNRAGGLKIVESGSGGLEVANVTGEVEIDD